MKFSSILLISAALAVVANAAPLSAKSPVDIDTRQGIHVALAPVISKRSDNPDGVALDLIIKTSADHYSVIAHARLDGLMKEIQTAKVTSGNEDMPNEKKLLTVTVQTQIDEAKKACSPEALQPVIMATVTADSNFDIPWSKKEEVEKKMADLDIAITKAVLDRIQATVNAELLSKDCTEKMTNTEIVPAPAPAETPAPEAPAAAEPAPETAAPAPEAPAPAPETPAPAPETPAPAPETPAPEPETPAPEPETTAPAPEILASEPETATPEPETPAPAPETPAPVPESPAPAPEASPIAVAAAPEAPKDDSVQAGIDVAASVDSKFVCKTGCKDSEDAHTVLSLRVNLENEFKPRLDHFYDQEVPTACTEQRKSLLDGVLNALSSLHINVNADVKRASQ
ncbi:hypothetical protein EMPS_03203 [Entomortierella parvispora]|uniref:Uncharacterized protein n=1 Tax=Entomortierella parvispora TaxID=205924 RepID=A0A9P3LUA9_9FUNG|nr:hypothetical protein EMPS_03203 [Entomortierella parvispora]